MTRRLPRPCELAPLLQFRKPRAAARAGIPFALSTLGTTAIEGVRAANPHGRN